MSELTDTLVECEKRLARYLSQSGRIGEQNTKAALIEPILGALGWDVLDPEEVDREYRRSGWENPVDYALLRLRTPRLFVEAKAVGENLDDLRSANQIVSYATGAGVEWVVLTNGAEWRIFNAHAPVPIEQKLFRSVRLADDLDEAARTLRLLGKEHTAQNRMDELWKIEFVDRRVKRALESLFSGQDPANELVAAVRHREEKLTLREVRESLTRARATFEFPAAEDFLTGLGGPGLARPARRRSAAPIAELPVPRSPAVVRAEQRLRRRPSTEGALRRSSLSDLLAAGRLRVGSRLQTSYMGQKIEAELAETQTDRWSS